MKDAETREQVFVEDGETDATEKAQHRDEVAATEEDLDDSVIEQEDDGKAGSSKANDSGQH